MPFLQLSNLSIGYNRKGGPSIIQSKLNLLAGRGEMIALIGKNGCGKSTLLRSISCMQPIFKGEILLDKTDVSKISPKKRAKLLSVVLTGQQQVAIFHCRRAYIE